MNNINKCLKKPESTEFKDSISIVIICANHIV